jgi:putative phage-type endonuclease
VIRKGGNPMLKGGIMIGDKIGIDGLDLCAIMGVNKNKSPDDVYLKKTSYEGSLTKKKEMNEADYWDCTVKEIDAKEFSIRSGKKVRKENKQLVDEEYSFMVGNIDRRVVGENSILICKTENTFFPGEWNGDELPAAYLLECQHYMRITKADKCYIASLIGGRKFVYREILRDEGVIKMIVQIEKDFWFNNILKNVPPKKAEV